MQPSPDEEGGEQRPSRQGQEAPDGARRILEAGKQPDPVVEAFAWVKEGVRRFMWLAMKLVRYVDHWEFSWEEDGDIVRLSVERFQHLLNLAVLDLFTEDDEQQKGKRLGIEQRTLADLRRWPPYESIRADIIAKLTALRDGNGLEALAPFFESAAAFEAAQAMFFGKKDRDKIEAMREFLERVAPKKSRSDGQAVVVIIPPNQQQNLRETLAIMEGFQPDPLVSAKRVRVPELLPAGEDS